MNNKIHHQSILLQIINYNLSLDLHRHNRPSFGVYEKIQYNYQLQNNIEIENIQEYSYHFRAIGL